MVLLGIYLLPASFHGIGIVKVVALSGGVFFHPALYRSAVLVIVPGGVVRKGVEAQLLLAGFSSS